MSKAQIVMSDMFFGIIISFITIIAFFTTWNIFQSRLADAIPRSEAELYAIQFANQLVNSPGIPDNWEENTNQTKSIGLSDNNKIISEKKLDALKNLSYDQIKNISHTGSYNFYFILIKGNHSVLEIGNYSSGQSVQIRRNVIYQDEFSTLEVSLWK